MQILVVDDEPITRSMVSTTLRNQGHDVLEACDGETAWQMLGSDRIRLVVSDWMMPNLNGTDLCRRIRAAMPEGYIYVILCTSRGERADLIEGMDAGADDFLVKPISTEELRVRVRAGERVLDLQQRLAEKNIRLQTAYESIQADIRAAAWVQTNLLPPPAPNVPGVACSWRFRPSNYISGDIFNFFQIDDRHAAFYLLDVSGHGVPAALFSVALSLVLTPDGAHGSPLKRFDTVGGTWQPAHPEDVISELNRRFQTKDDRYFTMSYGLLDLQSSTLRLAQAGNPNPVLIQSGGKVRSLTSGGMPVGLWPEMEFDSIEVPFLRGDRLLLYSDGVNECTNARQEEFGAERLLDCLRLSASQELDTILNGLERELEAWHGSRNFDDDVSLLAIERTGEKAQ